MCDTGILAHDSRYELIRGEIIEIPRPGSPHAGTVKRLIHLFTSKLANAAIVSVQDPVFLDVHSMPLPDVALLKPRPDFYTKAHRRLATSCSSSKWRIRPFGMTGRSRLRYTQNSRSLNTGCWISTRKLS